jgi:hypothetical protein
MHRSQLLELGELSLERTVSRKRHPSILTHAGVFLCWSLLTPEPDCEQNCAIEPGDNEMLLVFCQAAVSGENAICSAWDNMIDLSRLAEGERGIAAERKRTERK